MKNDTNSTPKYVPPDSETIYAFARNVCEQLGDEYLDQEVVSGFAEFLKVLAEIVAAKENAKNEFVDNQPE